MQARSDIAFDLLCQLIETAEGRIHPDAARYSGQIEVYRHLRDLGALGMGEGVRSDLLCPWCGTQDLVEVRFTQGQHQGYCIDCGWVDLAGHQVTLLRVELVRMVRWIASALRLVGRYPQDELVPGVLWRLGEMEWLRKRRTLFFGRRLGDPSALPDVERSLRTTCAPGCGVLITTTTDIPTTLEALAPTVVPLHAVAHLRQAGFVIENLDAYLDHSIQIQDPSTETSLRQLRSGRIALIDGNEHPLSNQVFQFITLLDEAAGDHVHKSRIADALEMSIDNCKGASIFKRHMLVYRTFVGHDTRGHYWLKPEFVDKPKRSRHQPHRLESAHPNGKDPLPSCG